MWKWQGKEIIEAQTRSEKFVCVERFYVFMFFVFNNATLRILEQIKHDTRIDRKRFLFNDSHLCFIFSQYHDYCWMLTEGLSDNPHRPIARSNNRLLKN